MNAGKSTRSFHPSRRRRAFILLLVFVVIAMASLAALNFSRSMLNSHESSRLSAGRLQARMCAESGAQAVRLMLAYPKLDRLAMGGTWSNPTMFQALNVIPDADPARRGNFSILAPSMDEFGNYTSLRYGLQNESAKLNLNTLSQLDALASSGALNASTGGGDGGGGGESSLGAGNSFSLFSASESGDPSLGMANALLMSLPGMTEDIADAILDWLDEDEITRPYGAEFADYYQQLQPIYKPTNGRIDSIEQLLLVRGVTPQMLFGYDENRNGLLDAAEASKMNMGVQPGTMPGTISPTPTDPYAMPPPPLGWAAYLTLHSQEKNLARDGSPRINLNSDDIQLLYDDLVAILGDENWASFIVAYRYGGQPGGDGSPLATLASMTLQENEPDGMLGAQLGMLSERGVTNFQGPEQTEPWSAEALDAFDLTQPGSVQFNQVLDLVDATVTVGEGDQAVTYASPFTSLPLDMANYTPLIMDYLTTVDAATIPGRINIMECPQEILRGLPGLSDEVVEQILEARVDGSESDTRNFETWLAVEGFLTIDQMRALLPLITCGGDVFKAQIVGYLEGNNAFCRVEAVISGAGEVPQILFFRRMDHLGRGFDIATLGQRFDAGNSFGILGSN